MRVAALGLTLFIAATALGQVPAEPTNAGSEGAASRPSSRIRAITDVESGDGFAARYPGDQCIRRDSRTIFSEDFEGRDPLRGWSDRKGPESVRLTEEGVHSGYLALAIEAEPGSGGHLFKRLRVGYDTLHVRFYVRFPSPAARVQHFVQISADEPPRPFPLGGAGVCPDGGARFATTVEPFAQNGLASPGAWRLVSYWCEMEISGDGKYWGNGFAPAVPIPAAADRWTCVEVMVRANSAAGSSDGAQAFWIDGRLAAAYEGFRWRTDPRLKLNGVCLQYYVEQETTVEPGPAEPPRKTSVLFDDVVVATRYVGPLRPLPHPMMQAVR
jgi:hypothetical protein